MRKRTLGSTIDDDFVVNQTSEPFAALASLACRMHRHFLEVPACQCRRGSCLGSPRAAKSEAHD
jgi:hypothetical protein